MSLRWVQSSSELTRWTKCNFMRNLKMDMVSLHWRSLPLTLMVQIASSDKVCFHQSSSNRFRLFSTVFGFDDSKIVIDFGNRSIFCPFFRDLLVIVLEIKLLCKSILAMFRWLNASTPSFHLRLGDGFGEIQFNVPACARARVRFRGSATNLSVFFLTNFLANWRSPCIFKTLKK